MSNSVLASLNQPSQQPLATNQMSNTLLHSVHVIATPSLSGMNSRITR